MKMTGHVRRILLVLGVSALAHAAEEPEDLTGDEWLASESKAAEQEFAQWKATGKVTEELEAHAARGERADLIERVLTGDRLKESEIKVESKAERCVVKVSDLVPVESEGVGNQPQCSTVWRRITKDRVEIWTPKEGRMFDAAGKRLATAKVRRGDGWGREWYGAFLPDGRWVTTDLDERDDRLTMFSATGKKQWSIKGGTLIPEKKDSDGYPSLPLIAWARSAQDGKAWVVSVGSESGRGWLRVTPDGKQTKISCPWKECLPQQLGPRGMYTSRNCSSDDGSLMITRLEPSHGAMVGWPHYAFPSGTRVMVPDGGKFGILPQSWAVLIDSYQNPLNPSPEDQQKEKVWFFDAKGNFQHWIKGRFAGTNLLNGGSWLRLPDDSCVRIDKGYAVGPHLRFTTKDKKPLIPVELHEDISLGIFLIDDQLALGTWKPEL